MARRKAKSENEEQREDFTEQDQINIEADATRARMEAEQEAQRIADEQRQERLQQTSVDTSRMRNDRNRRR